MRQSASTTSARACVGLAVAAAAWVACGSSDQEIHEAKTSGYRADFAIVYSEALAATRDLYPHVTDDPRAGSIRSAWHPIRLQTGTSPNQDPQGSSAALPVQGQPGANFGNTNQLRKQYFIRVQVHVVGGKPWRVKVTGQAASWEAGQNPTPLTGAAIPPWLKGRVDALRLAIHKRLQTHAVKLAPEPEPKKPVERALDTERYGGLPRDAAKVVAEVKRAAENRDVASLRQRMVEGFEWSRGEAPSADVAAAMWQADSGQLEFLVEILSTACAAVTEAQIRCESAAQDAEASFVKTATGWRFASFVTP